jgi:HK97 family phage major capsid protein
MPSLMQQATELKVERRTLIEQNRTLSEAAAGRALTAEEQQQYDQRFARIDELRVRAEGLERQARLDAEIAETEGGENRGRRPPASGSPAGGPAGEMRAAATDEYRAAFRSFLSRGDGGLTEAERRTLSASVASEGGYLVMAEQFVNELLKKMNNDVFIRAKARKFGVVGAASLGVPTLDSDASDAEWTTELSSGNADSQMSFGKRELKPRDLVKKILASNKLLRASGIDAEAEVMENINYILSITQEKAFLTGTGVNQPLGIFTASSDGISTARDVSAGNTATAVTMDGLKAAKWSLKGGYLKDAEWIFHRDVMLQIDQIREGSGTGQYLWQPSTVAGQPDRLLNIPLNISEYAPNTLTANQYVGALVVLRYYWIADGLDMQVQRLVELYAATNQTGFHVRAECDGAPVLEEAFVRVKLAA